MHIEILINGEPKAFEAEPRASLLRTLRAAGYFSVKHGCETGDCGACAVLLDGRPVVSCIMLAAQADGRQLTTLESLGRPDALHPLQQAFVDHGAIQCGFCTPAMILVAKSFLDRKPEASECEVRDALAGVLCRCTGYVKPVKAILAVAGKQSEVEG